MNHVTNEMDTRTVLERSHDWVLSEEKIGVDSTDRRLIRTDKTVLPGWFLNSQQWEVEDVWTDVVPSRVMGYLLGKDRARRMGFGRTGLSVIVRRTDE
ncbi:MAG: hypothetical protein HQRvContig01_29 [Haloquadratum phage sp.]|nr:MAG: hypothetical protein HQRvContig01_29 [Haloquadratum phage sp.]